MDVSIKVVIFVDDCTLSMELVFGVLQRNVFADKTLDVHVITSKVTEVKALAEYIEKCSFSNMNGKYFDDIYHRVVWPLAVVRATFSARVLNSETFEFRSERSIGGRLFPIYTAIRTSSEFGHGFGA